MNREEIQTILPHREGMLLLDQVERQGEEALGQYTIPADAWFLRGHFPGHPVVPGVVLCEILAQTVCCLLSDAVATATGLPMLTGLNNVRFRQPVRPGDKLETCCKITKARPPFYFAQGTGTVNGALCVKADFSFALPEEVPCSPKS